MDFETIIFNCIFYALTAIQTLMNNECVDGDVCQRITPVFSFTHLGVCEDGGVKECGASGMMMMMCVSRECWGSSLGLGNGIHLVDNDTHVNGEIHSSPTPITYPASDHVYVSALWRGLWQNKKKKIPRKSFANKSAGYLRTLGEMLNIFTLALSALSFISSSLISSVGTSLSAKKCWIRRCPMNWLQIFLASSGRSC